MRSSDWSSDVCSSDLAAVCAGEPAPRPVVDAVVARGNLPVALRPDDPPLSDPDDVGDPGDRGDRRRVGQNRPDRLHLRDEDRKRVCYVKSLTGCVDLGVRLLIKTNIKIYSTIY